MQSVRPFIILFSTNPHKTKSYSNFTESEKVVEIIFLNLTPMSGRGKIQIQV